MINGRPVEAVLVDLDNTLVDTETSMAASLVAAVESVGGRTLAADEAQRAVEMWWADPGGWYRMYEDGELTVTEQRRRRYLDVAAEMGLASDTFAEWQEKYVSGTVDGTRVFDDTLEFLDAVAHLKIAVVTNVESQVQARKLASAGIAGRLPIVLGADLVARPKPGPELFELAFDRLDVAPSAAVHIGDDWDADVVGAQGVGIQAVWLDRDDFGADRQLPDGVWRVTDLLKIPPMVA